MMVRPVKLYSDAVNVSLSLVIRSLSDLVCDQVFSEGSGPVAGIKHW